MGERRMVGLLGAGAVSICLIVAVAAGAAPLRSDLPQAGIRITGSGRSEVQPPSHPSQDTIEQALADARRVAVSRALNQARRTARLVASASGVSLGAIESVSDGELAYFGPGGAPGSFCRAASTKTGAGRQRCRVPEYVTASSTVTFAFSPAAVVEGSRTATGLGTSFVPVVPRDRKSNRSISEAVQRARAAALPKALATARDNAAAQARAAAMTLGGIVSISNDLTGPYSFDYAPFGPGRYCGVVTRPVFQKDPATGRRKVVGRRRARTCFVPRQAGVSFYVSFSAAPPPSSAATPGS